MHEKVGYICVLFLLQYLSPLNIELIIPSLHKEMSEKVCVSTWCRLFTIAVGKSLFNNTSKNFVPSPTFLNNKLIYLNKFKPAIA